MSAANRERLEWILEYRTQGAESVDELTQGLEQLNEEDREQFELSAKIGHAQDRRNRQLLAAAGTTKRSTLSERDLNQAMEAGRRAMQENALELESLRLLYDQGNLTKEEYNAQLQQIQTNLQGIELPSAQLMRMQRQVNTELHKGTNFSKQYGVQTQSVNTAVFGFTRMLTMSSGALGSQGRQILAVVNGMSMMTAQTGSLSVALRGMAGFMMSPAGIVAVLGLLAVGTLAAANYFSMLGDKAEAAKDRITPLHEEMDFLLKQFKELRSFALDDIFDTRALEAERDFIRLMLVDVDRQVDEMNENRINWLVRWHSAYVNLIGKISGHEDAFASAVLSVEEQREAHQERRLELLERIEEINGEIEARERAKTTEAGKQLALEEQFLKNAEELDDRLEDIVETQSDEVTNLLQDMTDSFFKVAEQRLTWEERLEREQAKKEADRFLARTRTADRYDQQLFNMRIENMIAAGQELEALEMRQSRERNAIRENDMILEGTRREMLHELDKKHARERKQLEQDFHDEAEVMWHEYAMAAGLAIDSVLQGMQGFYQDGTGMHRAFSASIAGINSLVAFTAALAAPPGPIDLIPGLRYAYAAGILLQGLAAQRQIWSGGTSVSAPSSSSDARQGTRQQQTFTPYEHRTSDTSPTQPQFPQTFKLVDTNGQMLTRMEVDRDRSPRSGRHYLSDR